VQHLPLPISEPGPILTYLAGLRKNGPAFSKQAEAAEKAVQSLLQTSDGAILLDLLEKAVSLSQMPIVSDERALVGRNAQTFIVSDLRRIASNETEQLLAQRAAQYRRVGRGDAAG
jgi:hypothetical protein